MVPNRARRVTRRASIDSLTAGRAGARSPAASGETVGAGSRQTTKGTSRRGASGSGSVERPAPPLRPDRRAANSRAAHSGRRTSHRRRTSTSAKCEPRLRRGEEGRGLGSDQHGRPRARLPYVAAIVHTTEDEFEPVQAAMALPVRRDERSAAVGTTRTDSRVSVPADSSDEACLHSTIVPQIRALVVGGNYSAWPWIPRGAGRMHDLRAAHT